MTAKAFPQVILLLELPVAFWTLSAAATSCWPFIFTHMYSFLNFQENNVGSEIRLLSHFQGDRIKKKVAGRGVIGVPDGIM